MRCSAWSSRAIWVCSAGALLLPATAGAHVSVIPAGVAQGTETRVELDVPNERQASMTGLTLEASDGISVVRAEAPPGWLATTTGSTVTWSGGSLESEGTGRFPVVLYADSSPGPATLTLAQTYQDGGSVSWDVILQVLPGAQGENNSHPERAIVAAAVGAGLIGVVLVVTGRRRRRRSLPNG